MSEQKTMVCKGCPKEFTEDSQDWVDGAGCDCGNCGQQVFHSVRCHDEYWAGAGDYFSDQAADRAIDDRQIEKAEKEGAL